MKKLLATIAAATGIAASAFAATWTDPSTGIEWTYTVTNNEAVIGRLYKKAAIPVTTSGDITIPSTLGGKPVTIIGEYSFQGCDAITGVTIPSSVWLIESYAFASCTNLPGVTIPPNVKTLHGGVFDQCVSFGSMTIPSTVTNITGGIFSRCYNLTNVAIEARLKRIPPKMFYSCWSLKDVNIPAAVTNIDEFAFYECNSLPSATLPSGLTCIGQAAFEGCSKFTSMDIPAGVRRIGGSAFYRCGGLAGPIVIPEGVTEIEDGVFHLCSKLESVVIPSTVTNIGRQAFSWCEKLVDADIPSGVTSIGASAFSGCYKLPSVTIPSGIKNIADSVFSNCRSLTSVEIPDAVTNIGAFAFSECRNLESVTIPQGVKGIGESAFKFCGKLEGVDIPQAVRYIGGSAFYTCESLDHVAIPDGVRNIAPLSFSNCIRLSDLTIGAGVTNIGNSAFYGCSSLRSVTIPDSVVDIGGNAFGSCRQLAGVTFGAGLKSIGDYAFTHPNQLVVANLPQGVTNIGYHAFGHVDLVEMSISPNVVNVASNAFYRFGWPLETVHVAKGDASRVRALLEGTGYDTSGVTFVEDMFFGDLETATQDVVLWDGAVLHGRMYAESTHKMSILDGATVTLRNATIDGFNNYQYMFAGLTCLGDATIVLEGANVVEGFYQDYPGIYVPYGSTLTIKGSGSLAAASSGRAAGIGGGYYMECGNIDIREGTVVATGGQYSAGIGGGYSADSGAIHVRAGITSVTATCGDGCTNPIGKGRDGSGSTASIASGLKKTVSGGGSTWTITPAPTEAETFTVTFNATGGVVSPGTKDVEKNKKVGELPAATKDGHTFSGWFTAASGGERVTEQTYIHDDVTFYAHWTANGGSDLSQVTGPTMFVNGNVMTGTLGGNYRISIADGATVTLSDVCIAGVDDSSCKWAGITCEGDATIILEGVNYVRGFYYAYPGIYVPANKTLTIQGNGSLEVCSSGNGAGIGAGYYDLPCGNIVINGGNIVSDGGTASAGIGASNGGSCGNITINGGTITATSKSEAAGIGAAWDGSTCGNITINGGTITANGGYRGAGIGSAYSSGCGLVDIRGGTITATGGNGAAGIGSGSMGECGNILIDSGIARVTATCGSNGINPIGAGNGGTAGEVDVHSHLADIPEGDRRIVGHMCKVEFIAVNGSVSPDSMQVLMGDPIGELPVATRTGHSFAGWFDKLDAGNQYIATDIVNEESHFWLYAHWTKDVYTITLDANGGFATLTSASVEFEEYFNLEYVPDPTRKGYEFDGWFTEPTGGTLVNSVYGQSNVTYYAHWTELPVRGTTRTRTESRTCSAMRSMFLRASSRLSESSSTMRARLSS